MDERVFQNRGVCGQAFPFLPSPPPSRPFLRSAQFSRVQKAESSSNLRKALRKRLLRRLLREIYGDHSRTKKYGRKENRIVQC